MSQNPENWNQACRSCSAGPNQPCVTERGEEAGRVHWGRGRYPERRRYVPRPAYVPLRRTALFSEAHREVEQRRFGD